MRGVNPGEVWMVDLAMAANVRSALLPPSLLQQIAKFFHRHPGILYYPAHRQSVHRVVTRYGDEMRTVAHDNVFALADNPESPFSNACTRGDGNTPCGGSGGWTAWVEW